MSEENKEQPLSEKRKTAMLRYMAIMFAVAFVLVAVSLVVQQRGSRQTISQLNQDSSSALQKAESLQTQNRELQNDRQELMTEKAGLEALLRQAQSDYAGMEAKLDTAKTALTASEKQQQEQVTQLERTREAYEALIVVLTCEEPDGNMTYANALETLKLLRGYLSENALAAYEAVLAAQQDTAGN